MAKMKKGLLIFFSGLLWITEVQALEVRHSLKTTIGFFDACETMFTYAFYNNKDYDINSLYNLTKTTIYYVGDNFGETYYVPVTKITNNNDEKISVIVNELKSSVMYQSNLNSYLNNKTELKNYKVEEEVMKLTFNDKIFDSIYDKNILEEVVYTIGKSVMENYDVKKVIFYVDDKEVVEY